jgi:hypothetical protein
MFNRIYKLCKYFCQYFAENFPKILGRIAHNVPVVYEGLAARIGVCAANAGPTNFGCSEPWEAQPT